MPFGISLPELLILLVVLLLVFGAKRLPEMGRSLGKGMREFKDWRERGRGVRDDDSDTDERRAPASCLRAEPAELPEPQRAGVGAPARHLGIPR